MQKGQITIFVILGLVVVVIIFLVLGYKGILTKSEGADIEGISSLQPELKEAGEVIEDCILDVAKIGLIDMGLHGGFVDNSDQNTFDYSGLDVTYLYADGESKLPSKEDMAAYLSAYVKDNARECLALVAEGFEVTPAAIKEVYSEISDDEVEVSLDWPISIKKGSLESKVDGFVVSIPVRLGTLHNEISSFMAVQVEKPDEVCLSCLIDSGQKEDLSIEVSNFITTYIFILRDRTSSEDETPYQFVFANSY